ncbi:hypothetical protein PHLCEN_2v4798, partial [Hermanssonia centrifuga]
IALALLDWDSGRYMPAREFNIAYAERVYGLAISIMHHIKDKSINMYHRVMHKVYDPRSSNQISDLCARKVRVIPTKRSKHSEISFPEYLGLSISSMRAMTFASDLAF